MERILIVGNSGAGKSTLAKAYSNKHQIPHLDLDTIVWKIKNPPTRQSREESENIIGEYLSSNTQWVIEGGYCDVLSFVTEVSSQLIFLNPGVETCINNCKKRPWELHKYESLKSQSKLYDEYIGDKIEYKTNQYL